jgi:sugar phosphate isomerase/epimerase
MTNPKIGLQLYTVREAAGQDARGTLQKVAEIGYKYVELAGTYGLSPVEMRATLDEFGLEAVSSHESLDALTADLPGVLSRLNTIGCKYVVCPGAAATRETDPAAWDQLAAQFNEIGRASADAGLIFGYHNHAHEFAMVGGMYGLDYLMEKTEPHTVKMELDVGWAWYGGVDPAAYLRRYAGRVPLIHAKDHERDNKDINRPVGDGALDWHSIFTAAREIGVDYAIVEEDRTLVPELESVAKSLRNIEAMSDT